MLHIALYCDSQYETEQVQHFLDHADSIRGPVRFRSFTASGEFLKYIAGNPYLLLIVSRSGPEGAEVVHQLRKLNPHARLMWFSENDCALLSYQLRASYYAEGPIDLEKLHLAFQAVGA